MQLELSTDSWDLVLDKSGNIAVLGNDEAPALLSQRIRHRLQTFRGECFLDRSVGVPYFSEVMKKNPDLRRIRALLVSLISGVEGVSRLLDLRTDFSPSTREYRVAFKVEATDGTIVEGTI